MVVEWRSAVTRPLDVLLLLHQVLEYLKLGMGGQASEEEQAKGTVGVQMGQLAQ